MQLFYSPNISSENIQLDEEESKHCVRVLRKKVGDEIKITDGVGNIYSGEIISDNPKKCLLKIIEKQTQQKRNYHLHIAIAPPKNIARFEWYLEKATEIGIDEITPLICERSERDKLNLERLNKILLESMKQSLQAYLPKLNPFMNIDTFIDLEKKKDEQKFIAYCQEKKLLQSTYQREKNVLILIGPEGDFTEKEIQLAEKNNFQSVSLGENRLRTETAGIVACSLISILNH